MRLFVFIVLAATPVLQFLHLSQWSMLRKALFEQNEWNPPAPRGVCFLLCVRLPVINDCSGSLTDTATTKTAAIQTIETKKLKEREEQKRLTVQVCWSWSLLHWKSAAEAKTFWYRWEQVKATEERKEGVMEYRARPGLEARLCLCLGLTDFPKNCYSWPLPSSLMKPSGICHPTTRPTPALHCSSRSLHIPPPHPPILLQRHMLISTLTQSQANIRMHTQAQRDITCHTQAANKGSAKRMCRVVAFVYRHCSGFCLVAFLLYP